MSTAKQSVEEFWQEFKRTNDIEANVDYYDCFHFDNSEEWANKLLALVLAGKKTATASSLLYYQNNNVRQPQAGDYSIVTDWQGKPYCVIQTTAVTLIPFNEMTYDICKREGEDDSLESWKSNHVNFFSQDGQDSGYQFTESMPVLFEDFKVVYVKKDVEEV